jgi:ribonuclease P protein component
MRNRIKRRLREIFRRSGPDLRRAGIDLMVSARPGAGIVPIAELRAEFRSLVREARSRLSPDPLPPRASPQAS